MSIGLIQYFDPTAVLDAAEGFHADVVSGVPTMLIAMINDATFADRDFSACSVVVSGGSSVPPELVQARWSRHSVRDSASSTDKPKPVP